MFVIESNNYAIQSNSYGGISLDDLCPFLFFQLLFKVPSAVKCFFWNFFTNLRSLIL